MPGEPFNLDQLRLVDLIDSQRSFSRAAAALGITQSAVSQQVRLIERDLGRSLFRRGGTGLAPTTDGEAYLVYARAMLAVGADAKRHFDAGAPAGEIRLGLNEDFARTALPAVLALFCRDHPRFAVLVECGLSAPLFAELDAGRFDVVVAKRPLGEHPADVLWTEPLAWYGRDDTVLDRELPVPLALVPAPSIARAAALDALRRAGRSWRVAFQSGSLAAIEAVVQAGIGVAVFAQHIGAPGLVELDPAEAGLPPLPAVAFCLRRSPPSRTADDPAVAAFCALLREATLLTAGQDGGVPPPA
ncbi:MAG: LysR family transcriptional regulator [Gluconacetobacter diazotrophicus]|nr:LysR family transcriptional regulator [Gluconacetobacter diazotrophicus]